MTRVALAQLSIPSPTDQVWSVGELAPRGQAAGRRRAPPCRSGCAAKSCSARCGRAGTGISPCATRESQVRAACGSSTPSVPASRPPTAPRSSCWAGPRIYERRASSSSSSPASFRPRRVGAAAAGAGAGQGCCSRRTGCSIPAASGRCRPYAGTVAVVTSLDGAALRDIVTVTRKRWPCARLLVVGARVQGEGAVHELVRALRLVNRIAGVDLCIVGRGGGGRRISRRSTAKRCAARWRRSSAHDLRRRPRDRYLAHRSRRRRAGGDAVRCGGAGRRRSARRARGWSTISRRAAGRRTERPDPPGGRAAGAHRRPAASRRTNRIARAATPSGPLVWRRSSTR